MRRVFGLLPVLCALVGAQACGDSQKRGMTQRPSQGGDAGIGGLGPGGGTAGTGGGGRGGKGNGGTGGVAGGGGSAGSAQDGGHAGTGGGGRHGGQGGKAGSAGNQAEAGASGESGEGGDGGEAGSGTGGACETFEADRRDAASSLAALLGSSAIVPVEEGATFGTTFVSAMAAFGFLLEGDDARALRILDAFSTGNRPGCSACLQASRDGDASVPADCAECGDPCPACACRGGYQQFRTLSGAPLPACGTDPCTGPDARNDYWIGDNAWLLAVLEHHSLSRRSARYDELIFQLREWFRCVHADTLAHDPDSSGIHSGFDKNGAFRSDDPFNPEGNIDVLGALRRAELGELYPERRAAFGAVRRAIERFIDERVWQPQTPGCFSRGPNNASNLPADHVSWGTFARIADDDAYACLPRAYGGVGARTLDLSFIDTFDRPTFDQSPSNESAGYWAVDPKFPASTVVRASTNSTARTLEIGYDWGTSTDAYFVVHRTQGVRLAVTPAFELTFSLQSSALDPDGKGPLFEVRLTGANGCDYWPGKVLATAPGSGELPTDGVVTLGYDDFNTHRGSCPDDLSQTEIREIRIALNRRNDVRLPSAGTLGIGALQFTDQPAPGTVDGLAGLEHDPPSRAFVEGTLAMAAAYCVADGCDSAPYATLLRDVTELGPNSLHATGERGLPSEVRMGSNRWAPGAASAAWMIIAAHCFNPFAPAE